MKYEKNIKLFKLDEKDFKNMINNRNTYINSGDYTFSSTENEITKLSNQLFLKQEKFIIKNKEARDENTLITIIPKNNINIPLHRPGEYLILSVYIAGNYYSRPYYIITSDNKDESEYTISVLKQEDGLVSEYLRNINLGNEVTISGLYGNTYYNSVRDSNNIIAICSNHGINAVYSLAKSITNSNAKIYLSIIYSVKKYSDIVFLKELQNLANKSSRIKLEIIISDEVVEGFETGYATEKIVSKYLTNNTTIFIYGPEGLLKYLNKELESLKLPRKYIRYEDYLPRCNIKNIKKYQMIIKYNEKECKHSCFNNKTILDSIEDSRLIINSKSRTGQDNVCNVKLLAGRVKIVNDNRNHSERFLNMIDPANSYPNSNIIIEIS